MKQLGFKLVLSTFLITGCSSLVETPYVDKEKGKGYGVDVKSMDSNFSQSSFRGNKFTPKDRAQAYSRLAAISECVKTKRLAVLDETQDKSSENSDKPFYTTTFSCADISAKSKKQIIPTAQLLVKNILEARDACAFRTPNEPEIAACSRLESLRDALKKEKEGMVTTL